MLSPNTCDDLMLSDSDLDQISAILSDFVSLATQHKRHLDCLPSSPGASDIMQKWIERAHDLRERIEARP